jgi:hypothetical protein
MDVCFEDAYLENLFDGKIKGKPKYSFEIIRAYQKTVYKLKKYDKDVLVRLKGLNWERLKGE